MHNINKNVSKHRSNITKFARQQTVVFGDKLFGTPVEQG